MHGGCIIFFYHHDDVEDDVDVDNDDDDDNDDHKKAPQVVRACSDDVSKECLLPLFLDFEYCTHVQFVLIR